MRWNLQEQKVLEHYAKRMPLQYLYIFRFKQVYSSLTIVFFHASLLQEKWWDQLWHMEEFHSANYSGAEKQNMICKCCQGNFAFLRLRADQSTYQCMRIALMLRMAVNERTMVVSVPGTLPIFSIQMFFCYTFITLALSSWNPQEIKHSRKPNPYIFVSHHL